MVATGKMDGIILQMVNMCKYGNLTAILIVGVLERLNVVVYLLNANGNHQVVVVVMPLHTVVALPMIPDNVGHLMEPCKWLA